jgi:hypothetical protein
MKTLPTIVALLALLVTSSAWAGPSSSPFSTFRSFKHLATPGVETVVDVEADPVEASYVLRFGEDFDASNQSRLGVELSAVPGYREHTWLSDRDVKVDFRSPIVRVGVMQWKEGRRAVVIGVMRNHGFLPRFFVGPEACKALLPPDLPRVRQMYDDACDGEAPDLREARDHGTNAAEEEVLEMLRLQMRSGWEVETERLRNYVDRADHDRVIIFGLLQLAMAHMVDLEHEKVLDTLDELLELVDDQPDAISEPQRALVQRMGEASFFRLIDVNLATEGFAALTYWETYGKWAADDFDPQAKLRLAELYRQALAPQKASPLYLEIIAVQPANEVELLVELARTYVESKDFVRATATTAYIRERYPNAFLPTELRGLRDRPLVSPKRDDA